MPASQRGVDIRRAIAAREAAVKPATPVAQPPATDGDAITRDNETPPVAAKNKKEH